MSNFDLASQLCRLVHAKRLARTGERPRDDMDPLAGLPDDERQPWLDVAEAVREIMGRDGDTADRLRELVLDWDRYTLTIKDPASRDEMRRALVIEMRVAVERLWEECKE